MFFALASDKHGGIAGHSDAGVNVRNNRRIGVRRHGNGNGISLTLVAVGHGDGQNVILTGEALQR